MIRVLLVLLLPAITLAQQPERYYQEKHCHGIMEYVLGDSTRVDCLTDTHAIEYDFAHKWAEAVGQSLGYAMATKRRAGIGLIITSKKDLTHWEKLKAVVEAYELPIDVWMITFI